MEDKLTDKEKQDILACAKDMQSHMFRGTNSSDSFDSLMSKYNQKTIMLAMKMLDHSRKQVTNPDNDISSCVNRCMSQVKGNTMNKVEAGTLTVNEFYTMCDTAYKIFMNDDVGRALPIIFMYVKGNKRIGVTPITVEGDVSPMDYLKEIVYKEKPDAYCFCGEGAMNKNIEKSQHKYGDIINDPTSTDIVILQGNTKDGKTPFEKLYDIIELKDNKIKLKEIPSDKGNSMESEKLP